MKFDGSYLFSLRVVLCFVPLKQDSHAQVLKTLFYSDLIRFMAV